METDIVYKLKAMRMFRVLFVAQLYVQEITIYYTYRLEIHYDKSKFCTLKDDEALKKHELIQKHNMQQDEIRKQVITVIFLGKQIIPFTDRNIFLRVLPETNSRQCQQS